MKTYRKEHWKRKWWPPSRWKDNPEWAFEYLRASSLISVNRRFIFIHVPKTAGRSMVRGVFRAKIADSVNSPNLDQPINHPKWDKYFKFIFVRNPWDRMVSCYHYFNYTIPFDDFILNAWTKKTGDPINRHWIAQHWFAKRNNKNLVDFIGKFENLEHDWNFICKKISIKQTLPHLNSVGQNGLKPLSWNGIKRKSDYRRYYTRKTRRIVAEKFKEDIKLFEYKF